MTLVCNFSVVVLLFWFKSLPLSANYNSSFLLQNYLQLQSLKILKSSSPIPNCTVLFEWKNTSNKLKQKINTSHLILYLFKTLFTILERVIQGLFCVYSLTNRTQSMFDEQLCLTNPSNSPLFKSILLRGWWLLSKRHQSNRIQNLKAEFPILFLVTRTN